MQCTFIVVFKGLMEEKRLSFFSFSLSLSLFKELGAKEDIWGKEGGYNRAMEKLVGGEGGCFLICASQPNSVRFMKYGWVSWAGLVAHMRKKRSTYRVLVVKPE
jgi:hypothetical protein